MSENSIVPATPFDISTLKLSDDIKKKYLELAAEMSGTKAGFEGAAGTWRPPVVKLVQPVTTDPAKPATAKIGDFFTKSSSVKRPLRGVPAYVYFTRVRFVQGQDKKPSCSSENVDTVGRGKNDKSVSIYGAKCSACPYGDQPFTAGKATNCNNVLNVIFIPESLENVFQLQFSKSSFTAGRQLTDLAKATRFPWTRFYDLNTEILKREKGSGLYAVPTVSPVSVEESAVPEHLQKFAEFVCEQIKQRRETDKTRLVTRAGDGPASTEDLNTLDATLAASEDRPDYKDNI